MNFIIHLESKFISGFPTPTPVSLSVVSPKLKTVQDIAVRVTRVDSKSVARLLVKDKLESKENRRRSLNFHRFYVESQVDTIAARTCIADIRKTRDYSGLTGNHLVRVLSVLPDKMASLDPLSVKDLLRSCQSDINQVPLCHFPLVMDLYIMATPDTRVVVPRLVEVMFSRILGESKLGPDRLFSDDGVPWISVATCSSLARSSIRSPLFTQVDGLARRSIMQIGKSDEQSMNFTLKLVELVETLQSGSNQTSLEYIRLLKHVLTRHLQSLSAPPSVQPAFDIFSSKHSYPNNTTPNELLSLICRYHEILLSSFNSHNSPAQYSLPFTLYRRSLSRFLQLRSSTLDASFVIRALSIESQLAKRPLSFTKPFLRQYVRSHTRLSAIPVDRLIELCNACKVSGLQDRFIWKRLNAAMTSVGDVSVRVSRPDHGSADCVLRRVTMLPYRLWIHRPIRRWVLASIGRVNPCRLSPSVLSELTTARPQWLTRHSPFWSKVMLAHSFHFPPTSSILAVS